MNAILSVLPRAIFWSRFFSRLFFVFFVLSTIVVILVFFTGRVPTRLLIITIPFLAVIFLIHWLFRIYANACQNALDSEDEEDLLLACRRQRLILRTYAILSVVGIIGMLRDIFSA